MPSMWLLQGNTATLPVGMPGIRARKTKMKAKRGVQGDKIRRLTHERRNDSDTQILFRLREDSHNKGKTDERDRKTAAPTMAICALTHHTPRFARPQIAASRYKEQAADGVTKHTQSRRSRAPPTAQICYTSTHELDYTPSSWHATCPGMPDS